MITEDYVSFEIAKLLKEKGFDGECDLFGRTDEPELIIREAAKIAYEQGIDDECVILPTPKMTMKWLREIYDLHIIAYPWRANREERATHWCCKVYKSFNLLGYEKYTNETPRSYKEAIEAAIRYCLENLI